MHQLLVFVKKKKKKLKSLKREVVYTNIYKLRSYEVLCSLTFKCWMFCDHMLVVCHSSTWNCVVFRLSELRIAVCWFIVVMVGTEQLRPVRSLLLCSTHTIEPLMDFLHLFRRNGCILDTSLNTGRYDENRWIMKNKIIIISNVNAKTVSYVFLILVAEFFMCVISKQQMLKLLCMYIESQCDGVGCWRSCGTLQLTFMLL